MKEGAPTAWFVVHTIVDLEVVSSNVPSTNVRFPLNYLFPKIMAFLMYFPGENSRTQTD